MSRKTKTALLVGVSFLLVICLLIAYLSSLNIAVLNPAGPVGQKEKNLILTAIGLSMIVVVPVYGMLIGFAWRYREGNKKAKYSPNLNGSRLAEGIWWAIPMIIIGILAILAWQSSHDLDPFKPLASKQKPVTVQVIALQWRWLFIYPEQKIASVNYLQMPVNTPINFEITSDAPMNSFWIPQLGGQIYAMSGMATQLHLQADKPGIYQGLSANISGQGFADMHFEAQAVDKQGFQKWTHNISGIADKLDQKRYNDLSKPNDSGTIHAFGDVQTGLFDSIVNKFESPVFNSIPVEAQ